MPVRIFDILDAWRRPLTAFLAATVLVAVAYVVLSDDEYEAEAKIQVVPVAADDTTFEGFSVLREGSDEGTAAQTAADLVESSDVVDAVASRLGRDRDDVLDAVSADVEGASNVVAVRARWTDPQAAAQIANAFADEFVARRSSQFQADLTRALDRLRGAPGAAARVETLETYEGLPDPTVEVVSDAVAPASSGSPSPLAIVGGAFAGALLLALGAATALAALAPRERALALDVQDESAAAEAERRRSAAEAMRERDGEIAEKADELAERQQDVDARAEGPSLTLSRLERLVRERGHEFPDRVDEWHAYLFHLREHASADGGLSPTLESLALEVFAELLNADTR